MIALARLAARLANTVSAPATACAGPAAQALHAQLLVADMHADTLLSPRDPRPDTKTGHLDLPRLRAGHVALQVFSVVTNMPCCPGFRRCCSQPNLVALLAAAERWPVATWASDKARALHQAAKLRDIAADPAAGLVLLRGRDDVSRLLAEPSGTRRIGALLSVEGAQAIGTDIEAVDELADAGVRMLGLAHFCDNAVAGSAHGRAGGGISPFGWQVLRRLSARGMIVDLAHASLHTIDDFLRGAPTMPFVVSHTGLRAVGDDPRNLADDVAQRILAAGGLIGVGAWSRALGLRRRTPVGAYVDRMVVTIAHAIGLAERAHPGRGDEYVALGSDFDGWVAVGFDAAGWALLTDGLLRHGFGDATIRRVMGENFSRLLLRALP